MSSRAAAITIAVAKVATHENSKSSLTMVGMLAPLLASAVRPGLEHASRRFRPDARLRNFSGDV
jgi:hypothetical protein